jgi:hypothetical protein
MEAVVAVEGNIPAVAVQDDLSTALVGSFEERVQQAPSIASAGGHGSKKVDAPPEDGGCWQSTGHCQLAPIRAESTPTDHEESRSDDDENDVSDHTGRDPYRPKHDGER